jgi:hypothetical protein
MLGSIREIVDHRRAWSQLRTGDLPSCSCILNDLDGF